MVNISLDTKSKEATKIFSEPYWLISKVMVLNFFEVINFWFLNQVTFLNKIINYLN